MDERPHGGTAHLLDLVRAEYGATLVFVATYLGDDHFATAAVPAEADGGPPASMVDRLVHATWADPELRQAASLTREATIGPEDVGRRAVLVVVPLRDGFDRWPRGLLGVLEPRGGALGTDRLDLVTGVARRLAAYLRARGDLLADRSDGPDRDRLDAQAGGEAF